MIRFDLERAAIYLMKESLFRLGVYYKEEEIIRLYLVEMVFLMLKSFYQNRSGYESV